jgi:2-aminoadipate transaminase
MHAALTTMEECFPRTVSWTRPTGGYTIWIKMPKKLEERQLREYMLKHSVIVSPGSYYFSQAPLSQYIRISIASINEEEIKEGIVRLGKALHGLSKGT